MQGFGFVVYYIIWRTLINKLRIWPVLPLNCQCHDAILVVTTSAVRRMQRWFLLRSAAQRVSAPSSHVGGPARKRRRCFINNTPEDGKSNLEKATMYLADRKLYYIAHQVLAVGNPLVDEYLSTLSQHSQGSLGVARWLADRAAGKWSAQCKTLFALFSSPALFASIGLPTSCSSTGGPDDRDQDRQQGRHGRSNKRTADKHKHGGWMRKEREGEVDEI